jgi:Domain of Unknown Function (DUF1080)
MKKAIVFISCILLVTMCNAQQWEPLFNGKNLTGWSILDKPADVRIIEGAIVLHMTPHTSRHAFIRTNKKFKDFIFEVEFKRDSILDSGIMFRTIDAPDTAFSAIFGYMVKIDPQTKRKWTGGILTDYGNGFQWHNSLEGNEPGRNAEKPQGQWNKVRIEAIGQNYKVWVNDLQTADLHDDKYLQPGYIAFKIHYLQGEFEKSKLEIAFRNPKIITKDIKKYTRKSVLKPIDTRGLWKINYFR